MKNIKIHCLLWLAGALWASCEEQPEHIPVENNSHAPGKIGEVAVTPTPGGARIAYILPDDKDILYVKGIYNLANGEEVEVKSSFYKNYLVIEGLGDTLEHTVKLYTVSRSEVISEPIEVKFRPKEAAFWDTFRSIKYEATFGGLNIRAMNEARDDLAYLIMEQNEFGIWEPLPSSLYSAAEEINYTIRGYDTVQHQFGITLRDRWQNYTDTIFAAITPLFEEPVPSDSYVFRVLPGDAPRHTSTTNPAALWDGDIAGWPSTVMLTQSAYTPFVPHTITIDLGTMAKLSRIHIWDYPEWGSGGQNVYYARGAMRRFEVYGSENYNPNGDLDSTWIKMGEFESIKPSGLPEWVVNTDDIEAGQAGLSYDLDITAPRVRYIRIRCLENWEGGTFMALAELQVYGNTKTE